MKNELHRRLMSLASSLHERKIIKQMLMKESGPPSPTGGVGDSAAGAGGGAPADTGTPPENKAKKEFETAVGQFDSIAYGIKQDVIIADLLKMNLSDILESMKTFEEKAAAAAPAKDPETANPEQDAEKNKGKKGKGKGKKGGTVSPQLAALPVGQILGAAVKQGGGIDKSPSLTESVAVLEFIKKSGVEGIEQLLKEEAIKIKILFLKGLPQEQE